jgi:uroporphyrinogen decarboxylase
MNRKLLDALEGKNKGRPPVWLMRQAGRYLPEYQAVRQKHDFLTLCHTPELIAEVTLQPIQRFGFDAAILFSDILMIPEAMGLKLRFDEGKGPIFENPLNTAEDLKRLKMPDPLDFVKEGIKLILSQLQCPLLGFAGAPFTVASYMIEGKSSKTLAKTKKWLYNDPKSFHALLEKIEEATIQHLQLQIAAGVKAVQLFESWANYLAPDERESVSTAYLNKIKNALPPHIPVIYFCKGSPPPHVPEGVALSIDFTQSLPQVRKAHGSKITLQGNLDPDLLFAPKDHVVRATKKLLGEMENDPAWIFNLGHGILPQTPLENVYAMVEHIKQA